MTDPVGVLLVPETAMVTLRLCAVVTLLDAGVTATVGVVGFGFVPPPPPPPLPHAQIDQAIAIKSRKRKSFANRFIQIPFGHSRHSCGLMGTKLVIIRAATLPLTVHPGPFIRVTDDLDSMRTG